MTLGVQGIVEKLLDLLPKFLSLVAFYPRWVQVLFCCTLAAIFISVILAVAFYPSASTHRNRERIALDVSIITDVPALPPQNTDLYTINYSAKTDLDSLTVAPTLGYLSLFDNGGPISSVSYTWCPFSWEFPKLDVKVVNNSTETIFITEAQFVIYRSEPDLRPLLLIQSDIYRRNEHYFRIVNEGWGDVQSCAISYNVLPSQTHYEVQTGPFAENYNVDVSDGLLAAGVNLARLRDLRGASQDAGDDAVLTSSGERMSHTDYTKSWYAALGPFSANIARVQGLLTYSWKDANGVANKKSVTFETEVVVQNQGGVGAPTPPTAEYQALFRIQGSRYTISVPGVAHTLKAGETDRFDIRIGAARSCFHDFQLRLLYNQGESVLSKPVRLHLLMPRSGKAKRAHPKPASAGPESANS